MDERIRSRRTMVNNRSKSPVRPHRRRWASFSATTATATLCPIKVPVLHCPSHKDAPGSDNKRTTSKCWRKKKDVSSSLINSSSWNSSSCKRGSDPGMKLRRSGLSSWSFIWSLTAAAIATIVLSPSHNNQAFGLAMVTESSSSRVTNYSSRGSSAGGEVAGRLPEVSSNANVSTVNGNADEIGMPSTTTTPTLSVNLAIPLIAGVGVNESAGASGEGGLGVDGMNRSSSSSSIAGNNHTSSPVVMLPGGGLGGAEEEGEKRRPISLLEAFLASIFCMLIVLTVIGNTLVILSVLTTRRLRTVTNCFVMSLAVADWLVGLFVMPPAVAVFLLEKWQLGRVLCDIWISLDVLLCTASILSLCAISIDRYLAVTQPLNYSRRRRSKRLALLMILVVWVLAVAITCPPMLGWYDSVDRGSPEDCHYNQNKAYVVYSAMGSFFIPMLVMIYVYVQISCVIARRHDHMSEIEVHKKGHRSKEVDVAEMEIDVDNVSEPEPSSPRRRAMNAKQEVAVTSSGGSNASGGSGNFNNNKNNYKNAQYELMEGVRRQAQIQAQQMNQVVTQQQPAPQNQNPNQTKQLSTYRNNNAENWYNSTTSSSNSAVGAKTTPSTTSNLLEYGTSKTNNIRVHQKSMSNRILSLKRENKTTQTLAIVVGGFILCWLPFFISYLITPFLEPGAIGDGVSAFLTWLGWFNSAMNPFIYALYSVDFRAAFWRLTCRRFCKNFRKAPYASNTYSIRRT